MKTSAAQRALARTDWQDEGTDEFPDDYDDQE